MGRGKRIIPARMPEKLKKIRLQLGLNLVEMIEKLSETLQKFGYTDIKIFRGHIVEFETGKREPLLPILLAYSHLANTNVDNLIDDKLELSNK